MTDNAKKPMKAVIYCRVSSDRQVTEGAGLESQQTRCREYARSKGYNVLKTFEDGGISGKLLERPAFREMLNFISLQKDPVVVIIDHIDRLARDIDTHLELRSRLKIAGALLESPSFQFGDAPHEKLIENVMASMSQYQREHNAMQVSNRMRSRLLNGYWTFPAPLGYRYTKADGGGKILEIDTPAASLVAEAFKGFAYGRFASVMDVVRFMMYDSRLAPNRRACAHPQRVKEMLSRILYTGYIEYPAWDVSLRQGKHPKIVNMDDFERVQARLGLRSHAPSRKDLNQEFPLRGFALCESCNEALTASFSTGRKGKHPYYRCATKDCEFNGKSIKRDEIELHFAKLLERMRPRPEALQLTKQIVRDIWSRKKSAYTSRTIEIEREKKEYEHRIDTLTKRWLDCKDREMIPVMEEGLRTLRRQSTMLNEESKSLANVDTSYEGAVETVFDFISNPHSLWENGDFEDKRLVLKLAFTRKLPFSRKSGFGTSGEALPFEVLAGLSGQKEGMVEMTGIEPATFCLQSRRSTN